MKIEPQHDKTNKMICAPSEDLVRLRCPHEETFGLELPNADAQADLSLHAQIILLILSCCGSI